MKPGLYTDMTYDDYDAIDAMNNTRLGWLLESPAVFQYKSLRNEPETRSLKFGSAIHCAILEPMRFQDEYVVEPDVNSITKDDGSPYANPRASKAYKERVTVLENAGKTVLKQDDWDLAIAVMMKTNEHPGVANLLSKAEGFETTLVWDRDGLLCKSRLDLHSKKWIADLKSTNNIGGFSPWEVDKWNLHRQAAWYTEGARANGILPEAYFLPVVSNNAPEVALFAMERGTLQAGEADVERAIKIHKQCVRTGEWPGRFPDNEVIPAMLSDRRFDELDARFQARETS